MDIGLFCAKAVIQPVDILLQGKGIVRDLSGALAERFVLQELKTAKISPLYYQGRENLLKLKLILSPV